MRHREDSFTNSDGQSIYHQTWSPDGDAKAVVLLFHGLGEHSGRYGHVASALTAAGYTVHALDHRGHGRSAGKRAHVLSYDEFQRDLRQFRDAVTEQHPALPLVVLGHSMGGNLAVGHVLDQQQGVRALVLSGPALQVGDDISRVQLRLLGLIAKFAPGFRPQGLNADAISRDPAVVAAYRRDPLVYTGKIPAGTVAALVGAMQRLPARYPQLRLPVLLLHGTRDQLADIGGSLALEAGASNADVTAHYYEGLYHEVFNEPEQATVLADLIAWLDAVTS